MALKFGLPVTKADANGWSCADIQNKYITLAQAQKRVWLKAATVSNGCIRLAQPADPKAIQINVYNPNTQAYDLCSWSDIDPFDP